MHEITLDTTVGDVAVPLDQVLALAAEDGFREMRDKGLWSVPEDKLVLVWEGDEVVFLDTAGTLRSSRLPRTLTRPLGDYLGGQPAPHAVWADVGLVVLATHAGFVLEGDYCLALDRGTERPVGVLVSSQAKGLLPLLRVPGWPDGWQDTFALNAVMHVSGETTLVELVGRVEDLLIDEEAHVASYYEDNEQWIVYALKDLVNAVNATMPRPPGDYRVGRMFPRITAALAQVSALDDTDWAVVQDRLPEGTSQQLLLTRGDEPAFALRRKEFRPVVRGFGPKAALRGGSLAQFVAEYPVTPTAAHQGRVVNTWFADQTKAHVPSTHALAANTLYHLGVNVGAPDKERTKVVGPQPEIPPKIVAAAAASGEELTLRVDSEGFYVIDREQTITLPDTGTTPDIFFRVATPVDTGTAHLRLGVYLKGNLVQSYQVYAQVAPIEGQMPAEGVDGWWSECEYTLSVDLNDVQGLSLRRVCVWFGEGKEGAQRAGVSATGLDTGPGLDVDAVFIGNALARYRELLHEASFELPEGKSDLEYRYEQDLTPRQDGVFRDSLLDLAELGQMLYQRLFGTDEGKRVIATIHDLERNESGPLVVQIARLNLDATFPWAVIYDRPLRYSPRRNEICSQFLKGSNCAQGCAVDDPNVVCPYGFWGFRYIIEQPLRPPGAFTSVATQLAVDGSPHLTLVYGVDLQLTETHRKALHTIIDTKAEAKTPDNTDDLLEELQSNPAVVYFYCHGGNKPYRQWMVVAKRDPFLVSYLSDDLREEWAGGAPLVVLNGCHTGKYDPSTLLSFIHRLGELGAAGVIGTEVPIHEWMGSDFGQFLFERLLAGGQVGQIVHDYRQRLLAKQNLLGLVYVPYCYADLRLAGGEV